MTRLHASRWAMMLCLSASLLAPTESAAEEPYRPEPGKFAPLEKAHSYRGELVFVDHANRRGSIRVEGTGKFYRNDPQPFAMLPYGVIRYHGAAGGSARRSARDRDARTGLSAA